MAGQGALRNAINDLLSDNPITTWWKAYIERAAGRWIEMENDARARASSHPLKFVTFSAAYVGGVLIYTVTGFRAVINIVGLLVGGEPTPDLSGEIAGYMQKIFSDPRAREGFESIGALITDGVINIFEQFAGDDVKDPKEFARAFHGFMIGLTLGGGIADTTLEATTGGQVEGAGRALESMYWSLGLGFLGWQTLAPLLESGLQPGLSRFYQRKYRPMRFTAAELRDLFALNEITQDTLRDEARTLGWRDQDIDKWVRLAFRSLNEADIWQAHRLGEISEAEVVRRLTALGFDPQDIPLLFKINAREDTGNAAQLTISTARAAFREGLLGEAGMRSALAALKRSAPEIDLILALDTRQRDQDRVALTVAQIKQAWEENVLSDQEAKFWLTQTGIDDASRDILVMTWRAETAPKFRKLNIGTITGAYVAGVIDRPAAQGKLESVNVAPVDARLELDLAEARNPEAFGKPRPRPLKLITPSLMSELVVRGVLTADQAQAYLIGAGFAEADAVLLAELFRRQAAPAPRPLSASLIAAAYAEHVLDREGAFARLRTLGLSPADADVALDTIEAQYPDAFGTLPAPPPRALTPAQLADLVIAQIVTSEVMSARLQASGFSPEDAALLSQLAAREAGGLPRLLSQSTIERAYTAQVVDRTQASGLLADLGLDEEGTRIVLDTVEADNPAIFNPSSVQSARQPSTAALVSALQNGIVTEGEYFARMAEAGYDDPAARIFLAVATRNERVASKTLTKAEIAEAYRKGIFQRGEAHARFLSLGYNDADADLLLRLERSGIEDTEVWRNMLAGLLTPEDAYGQLLGLGFSPQEIDAAIQRIS